ncbi:hypothetical protein Tco_1102971 [Tanacetum coccineum]
MALSIADQIALDGAGGSCDRLKSGNAILRLEFGYYIHGRIPFKVEFWALAYVHNRSVHFKMNNKKHIIGLEQLRDFLQICHKVEMINVTTINGYLGMEATQLYGLSCQKNSFLRQKGSKKKVIQMSIPKRKPSLAHQEAEMPVKKLIALMLMVLGAEMKELGDYTRGFPMLSDYDSDEKKMMIEHDDERNDHEVVMLSLTLMRIEIIHEKVLDEEDSSISSSDEDDSDNDVEGAEGLQVRLKSDEDATDEKDQGNEAVKDTNTDLDGRDKVMTDVEDTHVTLTPVNPDGQQQSSSVSSGFVSNMLNPNQDTGVDDIFRQHTEATSLIDTSVTAIMEPSFTAQINRPPTPHPIVIQTQQPPIMTPATTTSSLLQNLPNFASLFGFDYRLKALEDNFSELRQTNQYAEALSSIPSTVDQYLANKMQEAVDIAV